MLCVSVILTGGAADWVQTIRYDGRHLTLVLNDLWVFVFNIKFESRIIEYYMQITVLAANPVSNKDRVVAVWHA